MPDESLATRRHVLAGAGAAAAGGVLVLGLPDAVSAQGGRAREVGSGPTDRYGIGFLMAIDQVGTSLVGVGYVTRARGLDDRALFTRPPARDSSDPRAQDASAARLTFHIEARLEALAQLREVITSRGAGRMRIYFQEDGGATFDDASSFRRGTQVARLTATFQNDLTLIAPNTAAVTTSAELTQAAVRTFVAGGRRVRLGGSGLPWSLRAQGRGQRTEPTAPRSQIVVSGELGVVDAARRR